MALQRAGLQFVNEGLDGFLRGVNSANNAIDSFGRAAGQVGDKIGTFGNVAIGAFREVGAAATRAALDLGRAAGAMAFDMGTKALGGAMDLQDSMNMLKATSGATEVQLGQLKQRARELGADLTLPATSAADAGTAMLELSKAGLSVDQVLGATKGTLQLAAAANITEAEAAEIAANALNVFNLSGDKATDVADMLAAAANKSSIDVKQAADSFKMAGSVFSAFQGPVVGSEKAMTDLTTAIALLGNAGIKGSDAGTSLKQMLLQLTGPSQIAKEKMQALALAAMSTNASMEDLNAVGFGNAAERAEGLSNILATTGLDLAKTGDIAFDASGKMRPLTEIIDLVTKGTQNMTQEQRANYLTSIFGADATRAVIALMQAGPAAFNEMSTAISKQGAATELATARTAGLRGAWDGFKSTLETVGLVLAEPFLEPLELGLRRVGEEINKLPIDAWAATTTQALTRLTQAAHDGAFSFDSIMKRIRTFGLELRDELVGRISAAIPDVQERGRELGNAAIQWANETVPELQERGRQLADAAVRWITEAGPPAIERLLDYRNQVVDFILDHVPDVIDALSSWSIELLSWIERAAPGMLRTFGEKTGDLIAIIGEHTPGIINALGDWIAALGQWIVDAGPGMLRNLGGTVGNLLDEIGRQLPGIVEALASWGAEMVEWIIDAAPGLFRELLTLNTDLLVWIGERIPGIAEQLGKWALAFVEWVGPTVGKLIISLGIMFGELLQWIIDKGPGLLETLGDWGLAFGKWVALDALPALTDALFDLGGEIIWWIGRKAEELTGTTSIGTSLIDGMKNGISGAWSGFIAWLNDQWHMMMFEIRYFFGIYSPSQVMADEIGKPLIQGLIDGIQSMWETLWSFSYRFFDDTVIKRFKELVGGVWMIGRDIVDGIYQGLQDHWQGFLDDMGSLVDLLPESIKKILGISSPSKLAIETIGKPFAQGIEVGFTQGLIDMQRSMMSSVASLASPQMVTPALGAAQIGASQAVSSSVTNQRNYYYSPTYGGAPPSPTQDFAIMKAFAQ